MRSTLKFALLLGSFLSISMGSQAAINSESGAGIMDGVEAFTKFEEIASKMKSMPVPVLDIISVPTHGIVAVEQEFNRLRTEVEDKTKDAIKKRISSIGNDLSKVKIPVDGVICPENGVIGKGLVDVDSELEREGKSTTYALAQEQQEKWTSSAGTVTGRAGYQAERRYAEQEQAVRMLSEAFVLKKKVEEELTKAINDVRGHYNSSKTPGNLVGKEDTVSEGSDSNKALREYAYYSLVYDHLLSLEQQVIGLRLQAKGGSTAQGMEVISDKI